MNADGFDYPRWIQEALRQVPKMVLNHLAATGLPPEPHHFYLTFRTGHPEVMMAPYLRDSYPEEMTIILKTQFRDLEVEDEGFSVTLFFSGAPESLYVPFAALTGFVDPGADFGLRFDGAPQTEAEEEAPPAEDGDSTPAGGERKGAEVVSIDRFRR